MAIISITTSSRDQSTAAESLSQYLEQLNCRHAYIGGFAWALLGSRRPTEINVLVETVNLDIKTLREKLTELNRQFASAGIKLFYVKEPIGDLRDDDLVRASKDNVLIETLKAGTMGLPIVAEPVYVVEHESGRRINILHPGILILTKMKRWSHYHDSDRPKTVIKNKSDQADIEFMLNWLAASEMFIDFEQYQGKSRSDLLGIVRVYRNKFISNTDLMDTLKMVMRPEDWDELCDEEVAIETSNSTVHLNE
ncbi:hypothetical protein JR316_0013332 [Psilocybe cubensis]|uniref:Uncharacterized protein n=2 Tax=Psilocybe cubensis TaxID=181762 RepID=A0ACB8GGY5_PSICU|nr:hypothetical protein JR316_0013332 [Psilocybe cubensis]KAH9474864.1 hypothetical protein JR316_0013332 [Psilocybe cubensis]